MRALFRMWGEVLLVALLAQVAAPRLALAQEAGDANVPTEPEGPAAPSEPDPTENVGAPAETEESNGWRAHEALGLPWLQFGLEHRSRYAHLENDFRAANPDNATALSMRTLLSVQLRFLPFVVGAELQDSRAFATEDTPLDTTIVNPVELLQAYVGLRGERVLSEGDAASLTLGRMTMNIGSRRLVARNDFRNTINAFSGLDLKWTSRHQDIARAIVVMPVTRLPTDPLALASNHIEFDRENTGVLFWGGFFQSRPLPASVLLEGYVFGLHERDSEVAESANRQLVTPGLRARRTPALGQFDFEVEAAGQFGRSRASTAPDDTTDLTHLAQFVHGSGGYTFDVFWSPRLALLYDFASGDQNPSDDTNGRFDTLFGARRFDFGPTGIYGAFARSNINSPGLHLEVEPHRRVDMFAEYRLVWLAAARDAWTTAGLRDPSGESGRFVGQQVQTRARFHVLPENLSLDVGGALLLPGEFPESVPGGDGSPSTFVYTQLTGTL